MIYYSKTATRWTRTRNKQANLYLGKVCVGTVMSIGGWWVSVANSDMLLMSLNRCKSPEFDNIVDAKAWVEARVDVFMKKIEV